MDSFLGLLLLVSVITKGFSQTCVVGSQPSKTFFPYNQNERWVLDYKNPSQCSGKLVKYALDYHDISNSGSYDVYISLWRPISMLSMSFEQVEGSIKLISVMANSNSGELSVNFSEIFIYISPGSVVGAYLPNNDLPVVGYKFFPSQTDGLCEILGSGNETTLNCADSFNNNLRMYVEADIVEVNCSVLYNIENGEVILIDGSTEYGSEAQYSCTEEGYVLVGDKSRFCSENGTWNGTEPTCQLLECNEPDSIDNGQWDGDSLTYGSSVYYTCDTGYTLTGGDFIITCGANMTWNYTETPVCNPVTCSDPGTPINGNRSEDEFIYQSVIRFNCDLGYELFGNDSIECLANSTWDNSLPLCEPVSCGNPGSPQDGYQSSGNSSYTFNSSVEFSCNEGFTLSYQLIITCLDNGNWSNDIPNCELTCETPPIPQNGSIVDFHSQNYTFMTSIIYECNEGYILNGNSSTTCTANKEWSNGPPECIKTCSNFSFANGLKNPNGGHYINGIILQLSCSSGYQLHGENVIECLENGEWNVTVPECKVVISTNQAVSSSIINSISSSEFMHHSSILTNATTNSLVTSITTDSSKTDSIVTSTTATDSIVTSTMTESSTVLPSLSSSSPVETSTTQAQSTKSQTTTGTTTTTSSSSKSMSTIKNQTSNTASLSTGNVTPTTSTNITTAETETESSSTVVYGAISAVLVVLVLVVVMVVIISCLLFKRSSRSKKYDVGKSSGIINPMINTTIYDDANIANTNVRFQASEQQVQFLGVSASNFEDPVKTLKQCSDEEAEYSDLSAATISGTVCINRQSNTVTYRPSQEESISEALPPILANVDFDEQKKDLTEYNNGESHTNQLYMEINGGKRDLNEAIMEEPSYASNDDPLFPGTFTSQTHIDVEREMEKNNVNEQEKGIPIYASNDDPLIAETFTNQTYMDLNGKTKEHFEEGIENQTYIANEETSGNHRREKPVSSMNRRDITESMKNPTFLNQLYIQNEPRRQATILIYEAPATQQTELYSQLKRKNAKHIPRSLITIGEPLGSGFYGRVYKATYLSKGANTIEVAIKTLSEGASEQEKVKFLQEAAIMAQFKHINVLKLHGIVIEKDSCMIVTELMKKGDLKQLLVTLKPDPGELGSGELPHTLLNFSRQICMGLTYLSEKGFVHRDIAARNILVATNSVCKIADFGLSRDLVEENYYFANKEAKVPVKWTAPEALHYRKYSTASDVWSFGCLLYEIWTLGSVPFTGVTNLESIRQVEKGFRLPPPPGCSKSIYELMMKCWHPDPNSRPRFQDIMLTLLQQDTVILSIPDKDLNSDSQAGTLGATLNAGEKMYSELQKIYST